jgi:hypothetical protein
VQFRCQHCPSPGVSGAANDLTLCQSSLIVYQTVIASASRTALMAQTIHRRSRWPLRS